MSQGVNVAAMAKLLGVTARHVQRLSHLPGFPAKPERGRYEAARVCLWYIKYLQAELDRRGTVDSGEMQTVKLRLLGERGNALELRNAAARGELMHVDNVRIYWMRRLGNFKSRLRAIPATLGPQLTNKPQSIVTARITDEIEHALAELAELTDTNHDDIQH